MRRNKHLRRLGALRLPRGHQRNTLDFAAGDVDVTLCGRRPPGGDRGDQSDVLEADQAAKEKDELVFISYHDERRCSCAQHMPMPGH